MVKLKACPRCGGDLFFEEEHNILSAYCLQCGHQCDLLITHNNKNQANGDSKRNA